MEVNECRCEFWIWWSKNHQYACEGGLDEIEVLCLVSFSFGKFGFSGQLVFIYGGYCERILLLSPSSHLKLTLTAVLSPVSEWNQSIFIPNMLSLHSNPDFFLMCKKKLFQLEIEISFIQITDHWRLWHFPTFLIIIGLLRKRMTYLLMLSIEPIFDIFKRTKVSIHKSLSIHKYSSVFWSSNALWTLDNSVNLH